MSKCQASGRSRTNNPVPASTSVAMTLPAKPLAAGSCATWPHDRWGGVLCRPGQRFRSAHKRNPGRERPRLRPAMQARALRGRSRPGFCVSQSRNVSTVIAYAASRRRPAQDPADKYVCLRNRNPAECRGGTAHVRIHERRAGHDRNGS